MRKIKAGYKVEVVTIKKAQQEQVSKKVTAKRRQLEQLPVRVKIG